MYVCSMKPLREKERKRETEIERQIERQTDRQAERSGDVNGMMMMVKQEQESEAGEVGFCWLAWPQ